MELVQTSVAVAWRGGMHFEASPPSGIAFSMDAHPEFGGKCLGPTPVEALLGSLAACSAMDVIAILTKKRQMVTGYRVEVVGSREPPGTHPRPFKEFLIRHVVTGPDLDEEAVAHAVQLSDEKYCTVISTLREMPAVRSTYAIEPPAADAPR